MSKLLEIQSKELKFIIELKKQSSCSVRLTNVTNYYVAFKVKTTSPKKYCVRPNVGIVMPNSTFDFTVTMQVSRTAPLDLECKDKFLIQSTIVSVETTDEDITASMFVKDSGNYVEEKKLRVILVSLPDSPTLSPINGNLNQGMGRETSFSKDQPLSGVEDQIRPHMVTKDLEESVLVKSKEPRPVEEKLKPVKNVEFKLENDVKEMKPAKDVEELKPAKDVKELKPAKDVKELNPTKDEEEMNSTKGVGELKPAKGVGELKPAKGVEKLNLTKDIKELKLEKDINVKTVEHVEDLKLAKGVELTNVDKQELKLVNDVEDIKSKLSEFELKLHKSLYVESASFAVRLTFIIWIAAKLDAEVTISKLLEERSSNMEETKILQEKLVICYTPLFYSIVSCILSNVMSTTDFHLHSLFHNRLKVELSKRGVKTVQVGFPLLFVCMVALISVVFGYRLHP
ncbi:hypothetical protein TIFTF001_000870 [Ficus carica]|uniref:MSP domain-containing protein n=1 Tax=Ficus carica TaxID=3494 RepID=A0AA88CKU5_FICCA|nr:hypothetical protein TIFTF001_000870 [Ficus carica]